jgi:hypothetical protein
VKSFLLCTPRENANATSSVNGQYGMNPTGRFPHMFEEEKGQIYRNDNRDPYKEEIKIPPPDPYKRKNINYFSHSKDPYFLFTYSTGGFIKPSRDLTPFRKNTQNFWTLEDNLGPISKWSTTNRLKYRIRRLSNRLVYVP